MKKGWMIFAAVIAVGLLIFLVMGFFKERPTAQDDGRNLDEGDVPKTGSEILDAQGTDNNAGGAAGSGWTAQGIAVSGAYADAEVVNFGDKYRLYYSEEPETAGFSGKIYSAVSADGKSWTQEGGIRKEWATFPSVIKLPDGKYRMYFQNAGVIKSALSSDGLLWDDESGTRIDKSNNAGLSLENVAAPTVMKVGGQYVMVYRGDIAGKYSSDVPNSNTELLLWAVSNDGLAFEKKGIALDSRNNEFQGLTDGPEFTDFGGEIRVYFWGYAGVYHSAFSNDKFSDAEFDFSTNTDARMKFYPNPPSDPAIIKIGDKWFMYYGQHTKGIYYATL